MVWSLISANPSSGEDKYYIFTKGTYKAGRKGCDIIINKDKGVSRVHAEIVVDSMISMNPLQNKASNRSSKVLIRDSSKYGTFINNNTGSKEKVHEIPKKETTLKDGDTISFGTGTAAYRFCYVPLVIFVYCSDSVQVNVSIEDRISSIGACVTYKFCQECTHVLVHHRMLVKDDLFDAIMARKPTVSDSWLESLAAKSIGSEFPSCNSYVPTMMVEGTTVEIADPKTRESCLEGYTFLLEALLEYKFGDRLSSLLELGGATVLSIERFCSSSGDDYGKQDHVVCVIPKGKVDKSFCCNKLSSLSRVNEMDLICAILSGHLDASILISPPVVVSSSCSTDETVVADSDIEVETTSSIPTAAAVYSEGSSRNMSKEEQTIHHVANRSMDGHLMGFTDKSGSMTTRGGKVDESEFGNSDIFYSQYLVVKDMSAPAVVSSMENDGVLNFKRFRKRNVLSGNSFSSLIPFSKYPYKDSDSGTKEVVQSVKDEKKRKQMEAIAEDLFNTERVRRRGVAGSLHGLLTRG